MKKAICSRAALVAMALAAMLVVPALALSTTLTTISSVSVESTSQTGPPNAGLLIADYLGFNPTGGWLTGVIFSGTDTIAAATAASMLNVATYAVWNYGSTQTATDNIYWEAIYKLNGNPGWTANISLDYTYMNSRVNLALDGRTESSSAAELLYDIVPASATGNFSQSAQDALQSVFDLIFSNHKGPYLWEYTRKDSLSYDANYYFAAVSLADDTSSGSFPVGSMEVGDELYLLGYLTAESQAQAYATSVEIATMASSLDMSLVVNEYPPSTVPEPATALLLGSGLLGLAGLRKKFKR